RGFLSLSGTVEFGTPADRPDRAHRLEAELRHFFPGDTGRFQRLKARYQKVFPFDYDDFWITSALSANFGDFTEFDEPEVSSRFLRGVFGNQNFVEAIGAVGVEYRYALNRDAIKVGVYHDIAAFQESAFPPGPARVRVANAFGIGVHALIFDHFQLDVYTGAGFNSDGTNSFGRTFRLQRAFLGARSHRRSNSPGRILRFEVVEKENVSRSNSPGRHAPGSGRSGDRRCGPSPGHRYRPQRSGS
ncbi:MAG: hypothetical protein AAF658_16510, partial [Myxococcota bacterium]